MRRAAVWILAAGLALGSAGLAVGYYGSSYSQWSYQPNRGYYWSRYSYRVGRGGYGYHYAVYYRNRPRYVYYYNPVRQVYWGRFDMQAKLYSELRPEHRKNELKDIAEESFPAPGPLPSIEDAEEKTGRLDPPPAPPKADPRDMN